MMVLTNDLLSRYGFWDGDILDFADEDVVTASEWQQLQERGVLEHELLFEIVKRCVVPQLESRVKVCYWWTTHNPVRACMVDGKQVESWADDVGGFAQKFFSNYIMLWCNLLAVLHKALKINFCAKPMWVKR